METTINIHIDVLKIIACAADAKGLSRSKIIHTLLKKVMVKSSEVLRMGRLVQYQEKHPPDEWHTFHIVLREDEYEYFMDLKKLLKMSISLILAIAVKKYISDLLNSNLTDNNRFRNYVIVMETIDSIICWKLYWGYPPEIMDAIPKTHQKTRISV